MNILYNQSNLRAEISNEEWLDRCELASLYRIIAHYEMTDLIDTHISYRLSNDANSFLINRYGVPFEKMTASDLVKIDHDGNIIESYDDGKLINKAGFIIHSALHHARPNINCVIHTHTADGIAVSAQEKGLLPISQHALKFYNRIGYHSYEGIALSLEEQQRLVNDLKDHRCMILRNHGLLATGDSIARAFHEIFFLERACQIQIKALTSSSLIQPDGELCEYTAQQFEREGVEDIINNAWAAAQSLIEHQKEEYCL